MLRYLPYPDFKAIFVSFTFTAVNISIGSGSSPDYKIRVRD